MSDATATLGKLYAAFAAGDGDALGGLIGDTHWVEAAGGPYGGVYRGLGEVADKVFGPIGRDVGGFTAVPDEILPVGDDRAIALGFYRGSTAAGPLETRFAHLATVADGTIVHFEQFTDTHEWRKAVGL
ncbi:MAG: nuclear transport factor 2 family protein [Sphingomicrobium sp.]